MAHALLIQSDNTGAPSGLAKISQKETAMSNATKMMDGVTQGETCLIGQLETWPLSDVLLWLNKTGRSAMVRIGTGLEAGVIFFHNGHMYRCEWGSLAGERALWALLDVTAGVFTMIQRDLPQPRPNLFIPTEQLLLQFAIARDERTMMASA